MFQASDHLTGAVFPLGPRVVMGSGRQALPITADERPHLLHQAIELVGELPRRSLQPAVACTSAGSTSTRSVPRPPVTTSISRANRIYSLMDSLGRLQRARYPPAGTTACAASTVPEHPMPPRNRSDQGGAASRARGSGSECRRRGGRASTSARLEVAMQRARADMAGARSTPPSSSRSSATAPCSAKGKLLDASATSTSPADATGTEVAWTLPNYRF